jgi:hypothetical protein
MELHLIKNNLAVGAYDTKNDMINNKKLAREMTVSFYFDFAQHS